jgi:hypothetical protein
VRWSEGEREMRERERERMSKRDGQADIFAYGKMTPFLLKRRDAHIIRRLCISESIDEID